MSALTKYLEQEALAINSSAHSLDDNEVENALQYLLSISKNNSKVVITGVGKSGIVARKIAATFCSVGLMSLYLNPLDALHGDLGLVAKNDICIIISNSGETDELIEICPFLKSKNVKIIALVGNISSTISNLSDVVLETNIDKEICPLGLAPTASTTVSMAIGDALAAVWMKRRGISDIDFARNHPSGNLGKKLTLTVGDLMIPIEDLHPIYNNDSIKDIISSLTRDGIGCCFVKSKVSKGDFIGIITDGDLRRALEKNDYSRWESITADKIMTKDPITVHKKSLAIDALNKMENNSKRKGLMVLPVISDLKNQEKLVGFIRLHDLVKSGLK
tara:strand:- start:7329 stop:8327 length:999 start_codon:yes stop_codon:yes gene_type:complete